MDALRCRAALGYPRRYFLRACFRRCWNVTFPKPNHFKPCAWRAALTRLSLSMFFAIFLTQ